MISLVTADNFNRAETDLYFASAANEAGGVGKFLHRRDVMPVDRQTVVRPNRDTLYSSAVFDLDAGPVTITLPDPGSRFMSMMVIDEDQYAAGVVYGKGRYTYTKDRLGTRYIMIAVRTLVNTNDPDDVKAARALQDAIVVGQSARGSLELPDWDRASEKRVREALLALGTTVPDSRNMFGSRTEVDPIRHLIGSAMAWGGNPERDATYLNVTPDKNEGVTPYRLTVRDVPVDGFWSISVYNAQGYFEPNPFDAYTINNLTAEKNDDQSVTVHFGTCDGGLPNCLPIMPGWNYTVRLYRPRPAILHGTWTFPPAQPAG
jgi:hypothetical protein